MPICFICNQPSLNIQLLCKHFIICPPYHDFIEYSCAEIGCNRSFHIINSFKKHLATHIINEPLMLLKPPNIDSVIKCSLSPDSSNNACTSNNMDSPTPLTSSIIDTGLNDCLLEENYASHLLASLYSNSRIPRNIGQTVVNDMTSIFDNIHHTLQRSFQITF